MVLQEVDALKITDTESRKVAAQDWGKGELESGPHGSYSLHDDKVLEIYGTTMQ